MPLPRIDLLDPSEDGARIAVALRARGYQVIERPVSSLLEVTDAVVLVLAGDAPGALEALQRLRGADATVLLPVIVLGAPIDEAVDEGNVVDFGGDAFHPRPVELDRLARQIDAFVGPSRTREPISDVAPRDPKSEPVRIGSWQPAERTVELSEEPEGVVPMAGVVVLHPRSASEAPPALEPVDEGAVISDRLRRRLHDADRRAFPQGPSQELRFPNGDASPDVLVPAELLESAPSIDALDDEVVEQFVHPSIPLREGTPSSAMRGTSTGSVISSPGSVGSSPSGPPSTTSSGKQAAPPPDESTQTLRSGRPSGSQVHRRSSLPPRTSPKTGGSVRPVPPIDVGEPTEGGLGRAGSLEGGAALTLLWQAAERRYDCDVLLEPEGAPRVRLALVNGDVWGFDGPAAERVLAELDRDAASGTGSAEERLQARVTSRAVSRIEVDRRLASTRRALFELAVGARRGRFTLRPAPGTAIARLLTGTRPFALPLQALLAATARRTLSVEHARAWLGTTSFEVRPEPDAAAALAVSQVEPELAARLLDPGGTRLDALVSDAPRAPGLAGLLLFLVRVGAFRWSQVEPRAETSALALRTALESEARTAADGDYFAILGVARDHDRIDEAYAERRAELDGMPLDAYGLARLEPLRGEVREALDEAHRVLSAPDLRAAYRAALDATPVPAARAQSAR